MKQEVGGGSRPEGARPAGKVKRYCMYKESAPGDRKARCGRWEGYDGKANGVWGWKKSRPSCMICCLNCSHLTITCQFARGSMVCEHRMTRTSWANVTYELRFVSPMERLRKHSAAPVCALSGLPVQNRTRGVPFRPGLPVPSLVMWLSCGQEHSKGRERGEKILFCM